MGCAEFSVIPQVYIPCFEITGNFFACIVM